MYYDRKELKDIEDKNPPLCSLEIVRPLFHQNSILSCDRSIASSKPNFTEITI
jgi:hypothetical protein